MSILNSQQRAVIAVDTKIDRLVIDRSVEAFDALVDRGDRDEYIRLMGTAIAQMGYEGPVRAQDRPTAVDKMKTIIQHAYADLWHCSFREANRRLKERLAG